MKIIPRLGQNKHLTLFAATVVTSLLLVSGSVASAQQFLDITSFNSGTAGSFSGTLGGVAVTGSLVTTTNPNQTNVFYQWNATTSNPSTPGDAQASVMDGSSAQYSYGNIYSPAVPLTDQVGYTQFFAIQGTATITINFASPITNPVFHVANLDSTADDFSATPGLTGLVLLSGNGDSSDGLAVHGDLIQDQDPSTLVSQPPTTAPLTTGGRSAYGSVELVGTFTTLTFNVTQETLGGDGGSFTLSTGPQNVPEPSTWVLLGIGVGCLVLFACRHQSPRRAR